MTVDCVNFSCEKFNFGVNLIVESQPTALTTLRKLDNLKLKIIISMKLHAQRLSEARSDSNGNGK